VAKEGMVAGRHLSWATRCLFVPLSTSLAYATFLIHRLNPSDQRMSRLRDWQGSGGVSTFDISVASATFKTEQS